MRARFEEKRKRRRVDGALGAKSRRVDGELGVEIKKDGRRAWGRSKQEKGLRARFGSKSTSHGQVFQ